MDTGSLSKDILTGTITLFHCVVLQTSIFVNVIITFFMFSFIYISYNSKNVAEIENKLCAAMIRRSNIFLYCLNSLNNCNFMSMLCVKIQHNFFFLIFRTAGEIMAARMVLKIHLCQDSRFSPCCFLSFSIQMELYKDVTWGDTGSTCINPAETCLSSLRMLILKPRWNQPLVCGIVICHSVTTLPRTRTQF